MVFIINRLPSPLLKDKSPLELLTSKKVDYNGLRVFGCLTYCSTSPKQRTKFQPRSRSCVFLGYPAGYKGYKVMDLETNQTYISRNVIFHEDMFPYAKGKPSLYTDVFSSPVSDIPFPSTEDIHGISVPDIAIPAVTSSDSSDGASSYTHRPEHTKRISKLPSLLEDYYCNVNELNKDIPYPLSAYLSYDNFST